MTDEQIVRTLAEFMGYERYKDSTFAMYREVGLGRPDSFVIEKDLPKYLTSYDALAPVWRKAFDTTPAIHCSDENEKCFYCKAHEILDDACWFRDTPREHAEALATAIASAKETGAA